MFNKRYSFFLGLLSVTLLMTGAAFAEPFAQEEIGAERAMETSRIEIDESGSADGETTEAGVKSVDPKGELSVEVPGEGLCDASGSDLVQRNDQSSFDLGGGPVMMCQQGAVCYSISDCLPGRCVVDFHAGTHTCECP